MVEDGGPLVESRKPITIDFRRIAALPFPRRLRGEAASQVPTSLPTLGDFNVAAFARRVMGRARGGPPRRSASDAPRWCQFSASGRSAGRARRAPAKPRRATKSRVPPGHRLRRRPRRSTRKARGRVRGNRDDPCIRAGEVSSPVGCSMIRHQRRPAMPGIERPNRFLEAPRTHARTRRAEVPARAGSRHRGRAASSAAMMSAPRAPPVTSVVSGPTPQSSSASRTAAVTRGASACGNRGRGRVGASTMWPLTTTTAGSSLTRAEYAWMLAVRRLQCTWAGFAPWRVAGGASHSSSWIGALSSRSRSTHSVDEGHRLGSEVAAAVLPLFVVRRAISFAPRDGTTLGPGDGQVRGPSLQVCFSPSPV